MPEVPGGRGHSRGIAASYPPAPGSITDLLCWSTGACAEEGDFSQIGVAGERKQRGQSHLLPGQGCTMQERGIQMWRLSTWSTWMPENSRKLGGRRLSDS